MFKFVATKNSTEIFHRAVLQNDVSRTRLIIEEAMKDPRFNVDDINSDGLTALQFSCFAGNLEIVKILIQCGADFKIKDREGRSLLHAAAMAGTLEVAKYLIRIGVTPTIKDDKNCMPVDLTDDSAMIVLFLRAMLDQGFLKEMQEYMLDHPRLKRKIFQDLELAKTQQWEEINYMRELPYTSRKDARVRKLSSEAVARKKSRGTFSELSDSIASLHLIAGADGSSGKDQPLPELENIVRLERAGSICSSRSSGSAPSNQTRQLVLEDATVSTRPARSTKYYSDSDVQVPQPLFRDADHLRSHSDGYHSDSYDERRGNQRRPFSVGSSESCPSSANSRSTASSASGATRNSFFFGHRDHSLIEPIYENLPLQPRGSEESLHECLYANVPAHSKDIPPPLPPRRPVNSGVSDIPTVHSPDLPNETDSGIDVNEAAGRVFQLSLEEPALVREYSNAYRVADPPFEGQYVHKSADLLPDGYFLNKPLTHSEFPNKYHSWNSRTLYETDTSYPVQDRLQRRAMEYEELQKNRELPEYSDKVDHMNHRGIFSELSQKSAILSSDAYQSGHGITAGGWIHSESGKYYPEILL